MNRYCVSFVMKIQLHVLLHDVLNLQHLNTCVSISFTCITFISQKLKCFTCTSKHFFTTNTWTCIFLTCSLDYKIRIILTVYHPSNILKYLHCKDLIIFRVKENTNLFQRLYKRMLPIPINENVLQKNSLHYVCLWRKDLKSNTDVDKIFGTI